MPLSKTFSMVAVVTLIGVTLLAVVFVVRVMVLGLLLGFLGLVLVAGQAASDPQAMSDAMRQLDPASRVQIIEHLGQLGPQGRDYLPLLKEWFEVGEPEVQAAALESLKKIDPAQWEHLP